MTLGDITPNEDFVNSMIQFLTSGASPPPRLLRYSKSSIRTFPIFGWLGHFCSVGSQNYRPQRAAHRLALAVALLPVGVYGLSLLVCQAFAHHHPVLEFQHVSLETEYTFLYIFGQLTPVDVP